MNLRTLSDGALLDRTSELARDERKITLEILHHLHEIERRKLFAELGYPSLFEYCVKHLGYNEVSAQRRIASMRLLRVIPELAEQVQQGKLTISTLAKAHGFFKKEDKVQKLNLEQKRQIIEQLSGKPTREMERELLSQSLYPEVHFKEKSKTVSPTKVELTFFADVELQSILEKIRGVLSHKLEQGTLTEVIAHMAKEFWAIIDPGREPKKTRSPQSVTAQKVHTDTIPAAIKRAIWKRDDGCCAFTNQTGKKCGSRHRVQFDHYPTPHALGGPSTEQNLRLACFQHNARHAIQRYGLKKMERYWDKN
jgi:hypothetical protein